MNDDQLTIPTPAPTLAGDPIPAVSPADPAPATPQAAPASPWWRIADFGVLGLWIATVVVTIQHHEKWADEAQAWLLARDLSLKTLWFHELRYEGSPGLWHTILWFAQRFFHAQYNSISYIGAAFALAGVVLVLFKAPFPRPLRWMLVFTYFMVYQYAVIARNYVLLPLLCFAAAAMFKDLKHPLRMTAVLILLANVSFHGTIIAGCMGMVYLIDAIKSWSAFDSHLRRRYVLSVGAMLLTFAFLFVILKPTPDVDELIVKKDPAKYGIVQPPKHSRIEAVLSGALLDFWVPSAVFLLLAAGWCFMRRSLFAFILSTGALILMYAFVHGFGHHHGTVFVAVMAGLWIAWPTEEEKRGFTIGEIRATRGMIALLVCLFGLNIWDAAVAIKNDYLYPYSGAEDAANYLKSVGAIGKPIFGYTYGVAGVQAYFDHNILSNITTSYYHHGLPMQGSVIDFDDLDAGKPEYIFFLSGTPERDLRMFKAPLQWEGYELAHFSDGYLFFKRSVYERQVYFIFRRVR